ncbi:MAG TPA: hypothetical protein DCS93_23590 [Microscillaceae bacterium]|nr:hypothetical protein [Microscillaceae bacterium]
MTNHLSEKVAKKIKRCAEKQETFLNLRECDLEEIPSEVFELTHLEILDLGNYKEVRSNHIQEVPAEISRLVNLRHLDLARNNIEHLPDTINQLIHLQSIQLDNNRLKSLPKKLDKLTSLTKLEINDNLDLKILPASITQLTQLNRLKANNCGLSEFSPLLLSLTNLTYLEINHNFIQSIPTEIYQLIHLKELYITHNRLQWIAPETFFLPSLEIIRLEGNPLDEPPEEIIHQGLAAMRNYYVHLYSQSAKATEEDEIDKLVKELNVQNEELKRNLHSFQELFYLRSLPETDQLNEVKLLLVGEGRVGKTTLAKALRVPDYQLEHESSTEGIDISQWMIPKEEFGDKLDLQEDFRLNVWDFGGQEIYYSTHQFFLTRRSIYLFVTESRKEDSHDTFFYWLNIIKLLGDSSPVIMVLNKADQPTKELPIADYKARFPNIIEFKKVSSHPDYKDTIVTLKEEIKRIITNQNLLPQIGTPLPKVWIDIRKEIETLQQSGKNYISYEDYLDICERHQMTEESAGFLSRFFHDLGVFLHFSDDLELANTVFLNHEWVTRGVYQVLDNQKVKNKHGRFTDRDLMDIWKDRKYRSKQQELLALMKNQKFEICFALPGRSAKSSKTYLAPQLLPADAPQHKLEKLFPPKPIYLRFEYAYHFMPKGILTRFIVKRNPDIHQNIYWLYGVVLHYEDTFALVQELYIEKKIAILIYGKNKKELLSIIRKTLQEIHTDFHNLSVEEMIPCNCSECQTNTTIYFYRFAALKRRLEKGRKSVECDLSFENVSISGLLDGVGNVRQSTLENIEQFIIRNQIDNALDALLEYAKQQDNEELEQQTLGLLANWKNNENAYINQRLSENTYNIQRNSLLHQITSLIT